MSEGEFRKLYLNEWEPVDRWEGCFPHRLLSDDFIFSFDVREMSPIREISKGGPALISVPVEVMAWAVEMEIGPFQICYFGDSARDRWVVANDNSDHEIYGIWSICFERPNDEILFKLRWM